MRRSLCALALTPMLLAACSQPSRPDDSPQAPRPRAQIGTWGFDLSARDLSVKPGDDFYRHAIGKWLDNASIPADRMRWGTFEELDDLSESRLRQLIEALPEDAPPGSNERKVGDFYRSYLDTEAIERAGLTPARPGLDAIANARTHEQLAHLMGRADLQLKAPLRMGIGPDQKNPDRYVVSITQSGLGLPEREYYLREDAQFVTLRKDYQAHIARFLTLAGDEPLQAQEQAKAILELETRIARLHWPIAKRRERHLTYNLHTREQLIERNPAFPWTQMLQAAGLQNQREFVLRELDAIEALGKLFREVPVEQWRSYFRYHYLQNMADVLPKAFDDERFAFYGRTLNGQQQQRDRWKRAIDATDRALGEAAGQLYVAKYFPPESKAKVLELVENLRTAYAQRIKQLPWMSQETKKVALEKLATFNPKIGYPDRWRDYSALEIRAGDAFGNQSRAAKFDWDYDVARLDQPTDRSEWAMTPPTINAYYNPTFNEIVFPAAILQPPFFDPNADPAVNYGGIGGVIGHEMGHGFDDQGSKSDARGVLRTWWQPEDDQAFRKLVDRLATQYDGYTALPGLKLNGRLTLGENIGDLGGLSVAYEAYRLSLKGREAPVLDGLTGDQRFFLSWAQSWRALYRDERLRTLVMSDPHSPPKFRVNGVVRNMDAWYEAFNVQPGDELYLAPEERVRIW